MYCDHVPNISTVNNNGSNVYKYTGTLVKNKGEGRGRNANIF